MPEPILDDPMRHNYMKKLLRLKRSGALPPGVVRVDVRHDDGCLALGKPVGYCTCDPDIVVDGRLVDGLSMQAQA